VPGGTYSHLKRIYSKRGSVQESDKEKLAGFPWKDLPRWTCLGGGTDGRLWNKVARCGQQLIEELDGL